MNLTYLKQLLLKHNISQTDLAQILRRDKSVITNLFQGRRQLKASEAALIAKHIDVPIAQIFGISEQQRREFSEPPLLIPFQHEPEHCRKSLQVIKKDGKFYLQESEGLGISPKTYALEVHDDSMALSGIVTGDVVISELDRPCKPGQIVVAQHYQGRGAKTVIRKYQPPFLMPHAVAGSFRPLNLEQEEARLVSPVLKLIRLY